MIANLQLLRALAALSIMLYHAVGTATAYGNPPTALVSWLGKFGAGVDLFFVLSGFLMAYTVQKNPRTGVHFFRDRLIRILPAYWLLTLTWIAIFPLSPQVFRGFHETILDVASSLLFITRFLTNRTPILDVGWSLEYEMFFYAVLAICLTATRSNWSFLLTSAVISAFVFVGSYDLIAIEFIMGMCVAYLVSRNRPPRALVLCIAASGLIMMSIIDPDYHRAWRSGLPSALLVWAAASSSWNPPRLAIKLGEASYSIYLTHIFFLPLAYKIYVSIGIPSNNDLKYLLAGFFCILGGYGFFKLIEQPIDQRLKPYLRNQKATVATDNLAESRR